MKVAVYSTKRYDEEFLSRANEEHGHLLQFFEPRLTSDTAALGPGSRLCAPSSTTN